MDIEDINIKDIDQGGEDPLYEGAIYIGKGYRVVPLGVGAIKSNLVVRNREFLYNPFAAVRWGRTFYPEGFAVIEYQIPEGVEVREDEYYFWIYPHMRLYGKVIRREGKGYSKTRQPRGYQGIVQERSEEELKSFKWDKRGD